MLCLECYQELSLSSCFRRFKFVVVGELVVNTGFQFFTLRVLPCCCYVSYIFKFREKDKFDSHSVVDNKKVMQHIFLLNWKCLLITP